MRRLVGEPSHATPRGCLSASYSQDLLDEHVFLAVTVIITPSRASTHYEGYYTHLVWHR